MEEKKNPLKSKTLWLNILLVANETSGVLVGQKVQIPHIVEVAGILNIILRFMTKAPLGMN